MSNSYFRFKQFTIQQDKAAMKVCTDACLFGAWVAQQIDFENGEPNYILDIGSGTGLLSLMLAQKFRAQIDAVEVDDDAAQQTNENFKASNWKQHLYLHHASIQDFITDDLVAKYDIIISNPPFFNNSLKSDDKQKNLARHTSTLSFSELANAVCELMKDDGRFYLMLPCKEFEAFNKAAAEHDIFLQQQLFVHQTPAHTYFRTIGVFRKMEIKQGLTAFMTVKQDNGEYSEGFIELLKDYYLYL